MKRDRSRHRQNATAASQRPVTGSQQPERWQTVTGTPGQQFIKLDRRARSTVPLGRTHHVTAEFPPTPTTSGPKVVLKTPRPLQIKRTLDPYIYAHFTLDVGLLVEMHALIFTGSRVSASCPPLAWRAIMWHGARAHARKFAVIVFCSTLSDRRSINITGPFAGLSAHLDRQLTIEDPGTKWRYTSQIQMDPV
eukprot:1184751-Prorocentrum_minimum.AAC.4